MKASTTTAAVAVRPLFSSEEQEALLGFLAGYSGLIREAYALDLRQYVAWCTERHLALFGAHRADVEGFGRHLEQLGRVVMWGAGGSGLRDAVRIERSGGYANGDPDEAAAWASEVALLWLGLLSSDPIHNLEERVQAQLPGQFVGATEGDEPE